MAIFLAVWSLWQLKNVIDFLEEKGKIAFVAMSLQIFWQNFYRNIFKLIVYQRQKIYGNCKISLVAITTKYIFKQKQQQKSCPQVP